MKNNNSQNRYGLKHILLPLFLLILTSLIITVLITRNQGWAKENLPEVQRTNLSKVAPEPDKPEIRNVRPTAAADRFYPAKPDELYSMVEKLINSEPSTGIEGVKAILVPHAGYIYSGGVAAASFREIEKDFRLVFILAANHNSQVNFSGVSIPDFTHYAVPSAEIPLSPIIDDLRKDPMFVHEPEVHTKYMIEVELPFLHYLKGQPENPDFSIVPMILGKMDKTAITRLVQILDDYIDPQTLFVFSVDLSHFYDNDKARKLDNYTLQSIMSQDQEALNRASTDGNQVLLTMLKLAEYNSWEPTLLQYRNSGDVTNDPTRVVGYGSIAFHEPFSLSYEEEQNLLALARSSIKKSLEGKTSENPEKAFLDQHPILRIPRGAFVTLKKHGKLRGCIGELFPQGSLFKSVQRCAIKSATKDPRFQPLTLEELSESSISISVLEYPSRIKNDDPMAFPEILRPGKDGLILIYKGGRSTFLPSVWSDIPKPTDFLSRLCLKQKAPSDCWQHKEAILFRYGAYIFSEDL